MFRKLFCAVFVMTVAVGFVLAEEINCTITKVDGQTITYVKKAKKGQKGEEGTATVTKDAKIAKGKFDKATKKVEAGDAIEGGLSNAMFSAKKGVGARITVDGGKCTQILVLGGKKKKTN